MPSKNVLRLFCSVSLLASFLFCIYAVYTIEACYTSPCLSQIDYPVNTMKVSVSSSVSSVVVGVLMVSVALCTLYVLMLHCRAYSGGVLAGATITVSLAAWLEAINWWDEYSQITTISNSDMLDMYGAGYDVNIPLKAHALIMTVLAAVSASMSSITCLALFHLRKSYCVEYTQPKGLSAVAYQALSSQDINI